MAMKLTLARLEALIWVLIYAGLLLLALGLSLRGVDRALSGGVAAGGCALAALGVFLIWLRSRRVRNAARAAADVSTSSR
jgi:hypothetical protein